MRSFQLSNPSKAIIPIIVSCCFSLNVLAQDQLVKEQVLEQSTLTVKDEHTPLPAGDKREIGEQAFKKQNYKEAIQLLEGFALDGDVDAQYKVGYSYYKLQEQSALDWFKLAANNNHTESMYMLGECYQYGNCTAVNYSQAIEWYQKAKQNGHSKADAEIAKLQSAKQPTTSNVQGDQYFQQKNYAAACSYYQISSDNGDVYSTRMLAECYIRMDKNNHPKAVKCFKQLADQGDKDALYRLGDCYMKGIGVKKNEAEAFSCYMKAANLGHTDAAYTVAQCFEKSKGVSQKNMSLAYNWYQKAATDGHTLAQFRLGQYFEKGQGGEKDLSQAYEWYLLAAQEGNADAQYCVGKCIDNGVTSNKSSQYWYKKAAEQGHTLAASLVKENNTSTSSSTRRTSSSTSSASRSKSSISRSTTSRSSSSTSRSTSSSSDRYTSSRTSSSSSSSSSSSASRSTSSSSTASSRPSYNSTATSKSSSSSTGLSTSVVVKESDVINDGILVRSSKSGRTPYSAIKNEFYKNYGKCEFSLFGGSVTAGQGLQLSASTLRWRFGWFLFNPLECTLTDNEYFDHPDYFEYEIWYQPSIGFMIPCNDFSGAYMLAGPSVNLETWEHSYKVELGYRLHFGFLDLSRADIFVRYDGSFTAGISYHWSLGFGK